MEIINELFNFIHFLTNFLSLCCVKQLLDEGLLPDPNTAYQFIKYAFLKELKYHNVTMVPTDILLFLFAYQNKHMAIVFQFENTECVCVCFRRESSNMVTSRLLKKLHISQITTSTHIIGKSKRY